MQVKQQFTVGRPRSDVWDYFGEIDKVIFCMPGATLDEPVTGNLAKLKFNVRLGPISASFVGEAELERNAQTFRGVIRGSGRDSRGNSRAKGQLEYALTEEAGPGSTCVDVSAEFTLTGTLAQFSRSNLVNDLASRITAEFARNVEAALTAETAVATPGVVPAAAPARQANEISAGKLLLWAIWRRIKALGQRISARGARDG
jgi:carbon monoxide dehydrogenase subunit G